jgi:protein-S-isoprenylcysteine O-methyltransferase Ste14
MTRLPALGPRGEGWLAAQLGLILFVGYAPQLDGAPAWGGPAATLTTVIGISLVTLGVALAVIAAWQLAEARALTALPFPRAHGELVQAGAYRYVRHPIYSGIELATLGWGLAYASPLALLGGAALFAVLAMKAAREEAWLAARYPDYAAYRLRTKRLMPGLY